jgi:predicted Rossmann-fold nucleotide-binding protein
MRNLAMAEYADAVALFPGGKGTASMRELAEKEGILIYDFTR